MTPAVGYLNLNWWESINTNESLQLLISFVKNTLIPGINEH
jgi:hypothetical protein